ncbi:hypothetical protein OG535_40145 [Kitasatospora sp. NBC_00085]|uniref:hypothetical protein n=1 Tax=unclassified Kitasatospora TaxID=2633591 RepID=UPI0032514F9A
MLEMMSCTQEALEDYVTAPGRELLRQMMQDQLGARARAEHRRGRAAQRRGRTRRARGMAVDIIVDFVHVLEYL